MEMGARYLETDARMTRDHHVVLLHDRTVDRTTDGRGPVDQMTLEEVKSLDAGYRFQPLGGGSDFPFRGKGIQIPTLEEVLLDLPEALLNIEVKQDHPPMEEALLKTLDRCKAWDRVLLTAKNGRIMKRMRRTFGDRVATGTSMREGIRLAIWMAMGRIWSFSLPGQALQAPDRIMGVDYLIPELIRNVHQLGAEVHVWTVDDAQRMRELLLRGVDGIVTNFPDRFPKDMGP
jgi:glycerophosphoryl diester phosphodiesterase